MGVSPLSNLPALSKRRRSIPDANRDDLESWHPVAFVDDPDEVVAHDRIPLHLRETIVSSYGEEYFTSREWTVGTLKRLSQAMSYPRENVSGTVAQVCPDEKCPLEMECPFHIMGRPPIGERCPIELRIAEELYNAYVHAVAERLQAEEQEIRSDIIFANLIMGLVKSDIVENRLDGIISRDGFSTQIPSAIDEITHEVYYHEEESVAVRIQDRVRKRKDRIFQQLIATPEMAEKYRKGGSNDVVTKTLSVLDAIEKKLGITDASFTVENE